MDIINNDVGPASSITLGYFEAWNNNRECLHMDVTQMSKRITHVHFAFADVTPSFTVQINPQVKDQFDKFKAMTGHHKVVAFGGWSASTFPTSYWIFREGVKDANREMLATNLANFIMCVSSAKYLSRSEMIKLLTFLTLAPTTWTVSISTGV
jgi:chitinase